MWAVRRSYFLHGKLYFISYFCRLHDLETTKHAYLVAKSEETIPFQSPKMNEAKAHASLPPRHLVQCSEHIHASLRGA